jgi:hypothetical protein
VVLRLLGHEGLGEVVRPRVARQNWCFT